VGDTGILLDLVSLDLEDRLDSLGFKLSQEGLPLIVLREGMLVAGGLAPLETVVSGTVAIEGMQLFFTLQRSDLDLILVLCLDGITKGILLALRGSILAPLTE